MRDGWARSPTVDYGPNTQDVDIYLRCLQTLTDEDAKRLRRAFLEHAADGGLGGAAAERRAKATLHVIDFAVAAHRKEAHTAAVTSALRTLNPLADQLGGIGIFLADLAGAIVARDLVPEEDYAYLAAGWRRAMPHGSCVPPEAHGRRADDPR